MAFSCLAQTGVSILISPDGLSMRGLWPLLQFVLSTETLMMNEQVELRVLNMTPEGKEIDN